MLRQIALLTIAAVSPAIPAAAQQTVPAIQANASASATVIGSPTIVGNQAGSAQSAKPPPGWPPALPMISPAAPLDKKEISASTMARQWRDKADRPMRDANGVLRWIYGASQARIVCAPLQACDVELKPGEAVNNVIIADATYWQRNLSISGGAEGRTTHVTVQPLDAGRVTSMVIYTDQRVYSIKLVSVQRDYTPLTGFTYPDSQQDQRDNWASYRAAVSGGALRPGGPGVPSSGGVDAAHIEPLEIKGDHPSWRPTFAYTDGRKTYIQFPQAMEFGDSPTLLGVNGDGGLFHSPTERRVIYRWEGGRLVADTVMDRLKLVLGVGSSQQEVMIQRRF